MILQCKEGVGPAEEGSRLADAPLKPAELGGAELDGFKELDLSCSRARRNSTELRV